MKLKKKNLAYNEKSFVKKFQKSTLKTAVTVKGLFFYFVLVNKFTSHGVPKRCRLRSYVELFVRAGRRSLTSASDGGSRVTELVTPRPCRRAEADRVYYYNGTNVIIVEP